MIELTVKLTDEQLAEIAERAAALIPTGAPAVSMRFVDVLDYQLHRLDAGAALAWPPFGQLHARHLRPPA